MTPSAPKLRKVLSMLAIRSGRLVPVTSLMAELWDGNPPNSCLTTVQTYILSLRKVFASATGLSGTEVAREILRTESGGYRFVAGTAELDIERYDALAAAGRRSLDAGDDDTGIRQLGDALRLWRGPALAGVPVGRLLEADRYRLEESRLVLHEYWVDAQLRLGRYRDVLASLAGLTVEHPLHENLHTQYMRALFLNGRRGQALEVFHRLRHNLVSELGLEPAGPAQRLQRAILTQDPDTERGVWTA
ncbi:AfsR/SARP family transcriptional regulator [Actinacidiphila reveromycinica]|uniref:AfsR/SARP family transcriptional regulator n=1 Tax=Actinacidiphila reveromycinica TaxID=659352 RepID=UPI001F3E001C|nr:AfsR/SARP family transcriptional regulator [Streptomyces sp. SN-593]